MIMKKLYRGLSLMAALMMLCFSVALAQERVVSGQVTDENGTGMPGVNVLIKGTAGGTATDVDGKFSISVPNDQAVLVFSFVGYATQEVNVGSRSSITLSLAPDITALSEVVVTGYSSQRKQDITGAVSVVKVDELNNVMASSISQKLEGRASGVTLSTSGEPGEGTNIRIRGLGTFALDNDPLWIIDGVQSTDKGNTWLNPNDIETIQVLKDASSASIYGSRAQNGVIIVTTKKGKAGKTKLSYNGYVGVQTPVGGYDDIISLKPLDNAESFHRYYANSVSYDEIPTDNYYALYDVNGDLPEYTWPIANLGSNGDLINPITNALVAGTITNINDYRYSGSDDDFLVMGSNPSGTNWWDELFDPAAITEHNLSLSGGSENSTFNIGAGYLNQKGTMIHTNFDRFSVRANSQFKLGKVTFGENFTMARTFRTTQIGSNQDNQNSLTNTLLMHPIIPVYDIQGNFAGAKAISNGSNPVAAQFRNKDNGTTTYKVFGNFFGELAITNYLKFKSNFGVDYANWVYTGFNYGTPENREPTLNNSFSENWNNNFLWQWSNTLEFNKKFDRHSLNILAGYESIRSIYRGMNGSLTRYFTEDPAAWYVNTGLGEPGSRNVSSYGGPFTLVSQFGKIDYAFADKYLASFTIRRDGSSKFGANNRWATFPAVSLGWRVSAEDFMSGVTWLSDLKLRFGYGVTGNQNIPSGNNFFQFGGSPGTTFYDINGVNTGSIATGYALTRRGNADAKWEDNISYNGGIDMAMFDGKLQVVVDVYKRVTEGLLYQVSAPGTAGSAAPPYVNIGEMSNNGFDIAVTYRGNITPDLSFNTSLNLTHYKNQVEYVTDDVDFFYSSGADGHGNYVINKVGYPMASFYGYKYTGPIRSDAEAASLPTTIGGVNRAGGWSFADLDDDGAIDPDDRTVIGNPHPDAIIGANLGLNYKNFDFTMFLMASIGNDIYNYQRYYYETGRWGSVFSKEMLTDSWTPEKPNARLPQLNVDNSNAADVASSYYIEDGSYLRAKTIQIGYTIPAGVLGKIGGSTARIYVQAQNLFTITGYSGIDPVLSNVNIGDGDANDQYLGTDLGNYPTSKIFSVGVSLGF
jgi:TonB-dependent starch-binding outer membrane protein SusC